MGRLVDIILSDDPAERNQSLDNYAKTISLQELLNESKDLDHFRRQSENLYERVRALFFLYALHRFHIPFREGINYEGLIPYEAYEHMLKRRFEEAVELFLSVQSIKGPNEGISSGLADAYRQMAFQTLADQVRRSVKSTPGNQWMFRTGHPDDHPLRIRKELLIKDRNSGLYPLINESTPVRMDITHSGWSDIFFLGMDFPEGAKVLNISVNLSIREGKEKMPVPPIETFIRVIEEPVLKLTSVDLGTTVSITHLGDVFDFAKDYLGLLKAAVIASGIIPPGIEGAEIPLSEVLEKIVGVGLGIEIVSLVNGIPKGSRLAVSTNLLASLIAVCMRATGQIQSLTGPLQEDERRLIAARAILGEWLGGSGGGWQDSGGIWPGIKLIRGVGASDGDPEYGISRGRLLPDHTLLDFSEVISQTRKNLQDSLVMVHGGMAQDVGPILEMVTEKYLLRSGKEWEARLEAIRLFDAVVKELKDGVIRAIGNFTQKNFEGPIQAIIPWASNLYTELLIDRVREEFKEKFWGFWMMGGMSGGGMGFMFQPEIKKKAQQRLKEIMLETKEKLEHAIPFAMDPVVYDFEINENGSMAELKSAQQALMPVGYYTLTVPDLLKRNVQDLIPTQRNELEILGKSYRSNTQFGNFVSNLFERMMPHDGSENGSQQSLDTLLDELGFDPELHHQIQSSLKAGRIGVAQNRLPANVKIVDVSADEIHRPITMNLDDLNQLGIESLKKGELAVVSFAGGAGSRWTKGAGVVKSLNPFVKLCGKHRNFIEAHLAKSRQISRSFSVPIPHVFTTSYLTHAAIENYLRRVGNFRYQGPLYLSPGQVVGLRLVPMERDLHFIWEEMPQQILDEQAQKVQESLHKALIHWAKSQGEGGDYRDNLPHQCIHPVGHWFEIPNMLLNGMMYKLVRNHPRLKYLMVHNIDTLGANVDPSLLGLHISGKGVMTVEVINRLIDDRGGGLAKIDGRIRLVEGLALPDEKIEFHLTYYNSNTFWITIDDLLATFQLSREDLDDQIKIRSGVWEMSKRMPTYITIKDVKKRWGKGQEDIFPVTQFEKLWGDMTALPELNCQYVWVPRKRGQQLKEVAQLDAWLRDGSADYLDRLCDWD